jgi:putative spermidine/putrescine transport system permease protein
MRLQRKGYLLLLPAVLFILVFCLLPLALLTVTSFGGEASALGNYRELLGDSTYRRILGSTFLLAGKVTVLCLLLGYPVAYFMCRLRDSWRNVCLFLVIVPYLTSFLVRTYAWIVILADAGVINGTLLALGIVDAPVPMLYQSTGVLVGMTHIMLPFVVLPLYNVMRQIDPRLMQAARSLGSGATHAFLRVFLPLSAPGIRSGGILVFVLSLGFYITPLALGRARDITLAGLIEVQVFQLLDIGLAAASALILLVLTLAVMSTLGGDIAGNAFDRIAAPKASRPGRAGAAFSAAFRLAGNGLADLVYAMRSRSVARKRARQTVRGSDASLLPGRPLMTAFSCVVLALLVLPTLIVIPMSFNDADFLSFPPDGYSLRWYHSYFSDPSWLSATWLSVRTAVFAAIAATVLGTLASYALFRHDFGGRKLIVAALMSPLIIPAIVLGIGLYDLFVRWSLIGSPLGIVLAHTVVAVPYVLVTVSASLSKFDPALERASSSLGAGGFTTFFRITLPLIAPGVVSGALFAFIHSFDEVVVTLFVSGYVTRTLPLKMWENIRHEVDPTIAAISALLLLLLVVWLFVSQARLAAQGGSRLSAGAGARNR